MTSQPSLNESPNNESPNIATATASEALPEVVPTVLPTVETPLLLDDPEQSIDQQADADDPAIYVNASHAAKSLVITVIKNAGLRVYDLNGQELGDQSRRNIRKSRRHSLQQRRFAVWV